MRGTRPMRSRATNRTSPKARGLYGRGTGIPDPVDVRVGARVRALRQLRGMSQEELANSLRLTFQQVQKYEQGANRISASRLATIADVLEVPVSYFFSGLSNLEDAPTEWDLLLEKTETIDLVRYFYGIRDEEVRQNFLQLAKTMADASEARSKGKK